MRLNQDQFRTVIEQHQAMVFSIALRMLGDAGSAEEVAQDVFLELHRSADRLTGEDHVVPWLRRVSLHRATDALRKRTRQPETAAEEWSEDLPPHPPESIPVLESRLEDLLQTLPESMRAVIILRYQEDLSPDDIASLLEQPVATVKSNLRRALDLLRRKAQVTLKECCTMNQPDPLEQALSRALRRVQPPASLAASVLSQTKQKSVASRSNLVVFPRPRLWAAAAAAVLALGIALNHQHHVAQQAQAEREFALSEQITDHAYAQIREQLKQSGVQLDQE